MDLAWDLPGSRADIESSQARTVHVVTDILLRLSSDELFPDDVQELVVVFDQARIPGYEKDQDAFVGCIWSWRRDFILDLIGTDHGRVQGYRICLMESKEVVIIILGDMMNWRSLEMQAKVEGHSSLL